MVWTIAKSNIKFKTHNYYLNSGGIKMKRNMNTKKMVINALLLAIGAILHQITPALRLPLQPDFALAMLFIIMIINNNDYKTSIIAAIITNVCGTFIPFPSTFELFCFFVFSISILSLLF